MAKQVRIEDDLADWLAGQGGSLSSAANRTLSWARDAIDGYEEESESMASSVENGVESGQGVSRPRAGKPRARTSAGAAQRARYFGLAARRF